MPYITFDRRQAIIGGENPQTPGELNFALTRLCKQYLGVEGEISYGGINAVIGALECCKFELYRRLAAPYEDGKCSQNGDVYA